MSIIKFPKIPLFAKSIRTKLRLDNGIIMKSYIPTYLYLASTVLVLTFCYFNN